MAGLLAVLEGVKKGKGDDSEEEEAPESKPGEKTGYRQLMKEAAEDGDWDGFADAVVGLCKQAYAK